MRALSLPHLLPAGLLSAAILAPCRPVLAATPRAYTALRAKSRWSRTLTLAAVDADPAGHEGRVLELNGTVQGVAETANGASIMLGMANQQTRVLDVPASELDVAEATPPVPVRVLVKVAPGASGNVAPLQVLAMVSEQDLQAYSQDQANRLAAREAAAQFLARQRARYHQEFVRSVPPGVYWAGRLPSRGGFQRAPSAAAGGAAQQYAFYSRYLDARVLNCFVPYFNFIASWNRKLDAPTVGQITFYLLNFAARYRVDPRLVVAMIIAESDFDPRSTSRTGAMGLGQLMPETARDLGLTSPYDVAQNLDGSIAYLKSRLDTFANLQGPGGQMSWQQIYLAMAAYNAGMGAVKRYHGVPPYRETQAYVRRVAELYQELRGGA